MQRNWSRRSFLKDSWAEQFARFYGIAVVAMASLLAGVCLQLSAAEMQLQILHEFFPGGTNLTLPRGPLVQTGVGEFYATATTDYYYPGAYGAIFKITSDGDVTVLATLEGLDYPSCYGGLTQTAPGQFYGAAYDISSGDNVFRFRPNETPVIEFPGSGLGVGEFSSLVWDGVENLYTTTFYGGSNGLGSLVRYATNGVFTTLHSFNGTNGANPFFYAGSLVLAADGALYGTTGNGGLGFSGGMLTGLGTVFKMTTNGTFATLVYFDGTNGSQPNPGLTLGTDGNFYGTTTAGGANSNGTVFKLTPGGVLTTLVSFDSTNGAGLYSNGAGPYSGVTEGADGKFYGVTAYGGVNTTNSYYGSFGTVYSVTTNGQLNVIARFNGTNALNPSAELLLATDGNLYGLAFDMWRKLSLNGNAGAFFRLAQVPQITSLSRSNGTVKLEWTAFTNGIYRVERRPSLAVGEWTGLVPDVTSSGPTASLIDPSPPSAESYYRIVLLP